VTGQGALQFRVLVTSASLPEAAGKVLTSAHGGFAVDRRPGKGAPIYLLEDDRLVSTLFPKDDLGLENFKHVHNAVLRQMGGRLYVIAQ
jgi:hypothetical protein